jgi:phage protein D
MAEPNTYTPSLDDTHLLRTRVEISYEGDDITADIAPDLIAFQFTDNETGAVDDLAITLKDDHGRWSGDWLPARGDKITCAIVQDGRGAHHPLKCGTFTIDELEISGPPSIVAIKAVAIPPDDDVRQCARSRGWEDVRLSRIASDVAQSGDMALLWLPEDDPLLDRRDQCDESNLAFLERLCKDEGLCLKVNSQQLVVFNPDELADAEPVATFVLGTSAVLRRRLSAKTHDVYGRCTVEFQDPKDGKVKNYTYTDEEFQKQRKNYGKTLDGGNKKGRGKNGKTLKLTKRAASKAEAQRIAKAALSEANRGEITGSLDLMGDTRVVTGSSINLRGFGRWDGKYFVERATHAIGGQGGYTVALDISNTNLEGEMIEGATLASGQAEGAQ